MELSYPFQAPNGRLMSTPVTWDFHQIIDVTV